MQIPIYKPELPPYEVVEPEIRAMYASGMFYPGVYTDRLIEQVQQYTGVKYVLPVSSCSMGLMIALSIIPKGSYVVIPSFTFSATLQSLEWNGLHPVTVDVDDNGLMDLNALEDCLDNVSGIKAVLPVHMWGNLCDVEKFEKVCHTHNIPVFFDGAHVFGSFDNGSFAPGNATVFSIAATKPISAGEGGLIVTNNPFLFTRYRDIANHGLHESLDTKEKGINGKIQEFNSILAYHAIQQFDKTKARRRELMEYYRANLADVPSMRIWETREGVDPSYKDCVLFTDRRDELDAFLQSQGIGTKRYFDPAIPDMGSFDGIEHSGDNARKLAKTCLSLPLYPALTNEEIEYIITIVRSFFKRD